MTAQVCVDASLALMWLLADPLRDKAYAIWEKWKEEETDMVAPPLFRAEVTSVIRQWVYRDALSQEDAEAVLTTALVWPISIWEPDGALQETAFALATEYNQPNAYDAQYLAVASLLGCEFWTGDQRLARALGDRLPLVKWIGDYTPP